MLRQLDNVPMDSHSPLDYSRDRDRCSDKPQSVRGPDLKREPASPFARIARLVIPARQVFNPKRRDRDEDSLAEAPERKLTASNAPVEKTRERVETPKRRRRTEEQAHAIGLQIRPEEQRLLLEVGKFRVIAIPDLARHVYDGNESRLRRDLQFLNENRLIETHLLNARRDGKSANVTRFEAVTLTDTARKLLLKTGQVPEGQRVYSGLVKPREAEHDSQIYGAYLKEAAAIERAGGKIARVQLDFELKAQINRAVYLARKAEPERDVNDIKTELANQFNLKALHNKIVVPDARIEYEQPSGGTAQVDIEVATAAYRHGHIAHKVQAGFRLYVSNGDIGRLGAAVQDDHDLMSEILDI
jgi:hypothetical protein